MSRTSPSRLLFSLGTACCLLLAAGGTASAAGLLVADGGFGGKLEIREQRVQVTINNGVAVTQVDQVFFNTENRIVEALYTFPVPNGASVSNFTMIIDGKEMIGEVVEKQRAREIYESYKQTRRDPGLLEQVDFKSFELRVFPIAAGAEQHISITYAQPLDFDHNSATYVYPLETTTTGPVDSRTTGTFSLTLDVKSEIPIVTMDSPSHPDDFVISEHTSKYSRASLELSQGDLSRDLVIHYQTERPHTGLDLVTSKRPGEDGYFLLSLIAGKELEASEAGMDYVFLVDISGSMANDNKLNLSRTAVDGFLSSLGAEDRFEVLTFNSQPVPNFQTLSEVTPEAVLNAQEFLRSQRARGGTVLRPAVLTAYKYKSSDRPLNVVILSDGLTEVREQADLLAAIDQAPAGTRLFCIGIGNETNRPLLQQLAENAGGLAAFISHQDDFGRQAESFRRKLMRPVATDLVIEIAGVGTHDVASERLPDLYYGAPIRLLGRYRQAGTAKILVTANVLGQPFRQEFSFDFPEIEADNPEIERMWAFERTQTLMDRLRAGGGTDPQVIDEIVRLCEGYSIVSEYASFIVLENEGEYARWRIERRNANRVVRDRAARDRLRDEFQRLRDESLAKIGPAKSVPSSEQTSQSIDAVSAPGMNVPLANDAAQVTPQPQGTPGDFSMPGPNSGGGGGGAIDPISGALAGGLAAATAWAVRRRKTKTPGGTHDDHSQDVI